MVLRSHSWVAVLIGLCVPLCNGGCQSVRPVSTRWEAAQHSSTVRSDTADDEESSEIQQTSGDDSSPPLETEDAEPLDPAAPPATQWIDLTTALLLTSGENPQVALAQARIEESLAQLDRAEVLWLPSIRAGLNFNKHAGRIQDVAGNIIETDRNAFYGGLGANAVGAASPAVPGLVTQFHFSDAVFQPRIAQQTACARQRGAQAAVNDGLLQTALAYVNLLRAAQELALAIDIETKAHELERVTREFARTGEGLKSDHDRARTELALRTNDVHRAEEAVAVHSARLAEQIRWDSSRQLVPAESQLTPIELVSRDVPSAELVAIALTERPEVAESRHLVGEAIERLQRERYAPLIPSVLLGVSYGGLGGGLNGQFTNFGDRVDADAVAFWEIRQLGVGEHTIRREATARIQQSRMRELATLDRVAREVVESHAQVVSRSKQITTSQSAIAAAEDSFQDNWERIRNGQGLPIEVLQSLQALALARREYVRVLADYNTAQFTLHRSLGWPIPGT